MKTDPDDGLRGGRGRTPMTHGARGERGQVLVLMIIALVALLGTAALTMDVGFAWYAKRQVQASADAAALAGAQQLPDITTAVSTANTYATLNTPDNLSSVAVNVTTRCSVNSATWCGPTSTFQANTIAVTETANSPTWFAKIFGFDHFNVKGVATACQPCSSAPVDIMLVVDRTGSMCQPTGPGGVCTDLDNAKDGVRTLLGIMDPNIDTVGLVALPPYNTNAGSNAVCDNNSVSTPVVINGDTVDNPGFYDQQSLVYLDNPLSSDFKTSATSVLNPASSLVQHVTDDTSGQHNCILSFGSTSYDEALNQAQAELVKDGRPGVPKVIVFMTDGEANEGSYWAGVAGHGLEPDLASPATSFNMSPAGSASTINPGDAQPCQTAINAAAAIKKAGTTIYTIGYALLDATSGYAYCVHGVWGQIDMSNASSPSDYANFSCTAIGSPLLNPKNKNNWAQNPVSGHWQPSYPPTSPSNNSNPCTNTITGDHREVPNITSYQTLAAIASPTPPGGTPYFYNKPSSGDVTQIFAAIAADITKGTSRLVDDSY
jgi:Flp pilus assembly protein TadG